MGKSVEIEGEHFDGSQSLVIHTDGGTPGTLRGAGTVSGYVMWDKPGEKTVELRLVGSYSDEEAPIATLQVTVFGVVDVSVPKERLIAGGKYISERGPTTSAYEAIVKIRVEPPRAGLKIMVLATNGAAFDVLPPPTDKTGRTRCVVVSANQPAVSVVKARYEKTPLTHWVESAPVTTVDYTVHFVACRPPPRRRIREPVGKPDPQTFRVFDFAQAPNDPEVQP